MPGKDISRRSSSTGTGSPLEDDVRRHNWLFKDGPHLEGRPIVDFWGEEQSLCVKLGDSPLATTGTDSSGPVECLQKLIDENIDPSSPFRIIADFEPGEWPLKEGYRRLGDWLAFVGIHELDFGSWNHLQISLPDTPLPFDPPSNPIIPLELLINLRHLTLYSHRNQLVRSWLPLTPSIMQSLYTLDLNCELSIEDCTRILLHGKRLKYFMVNAIERNTDQVLTTCLPSPSKYRSGEHTRPYLEFLQIKSSANINSLLHPFYFPSLKGINFSLSYPTKLRSLPPAFEWKNMDHVTLVCDILDEDSQWIRNACRTDTQHNHISLCRHLSHVYVPQ